MSVVRWLWALTSRMSAGVLKCGCPQGLPGPVNKALAQGVVLCLAENSVKGGLAVGANLLIKDP